MVIIIIKQVWVLTMKLCLHHPMTPPSCRQDELNYFHFSDEETEGQGNKLRNPSKISQAVTDQPGGPAPACLAVLSLSESSASLLSPLSLLLTAWVEKSKWLWKGTGWSPALDSEDLLLSLNSAVLPVASNKAHSTRGTVHSRTLAILTAVIPRR